MGRKSHPAPNERNVAQFNADVERFSAYEYSLGRYSSVVATQRQTDEMVRMLTARFPGPLRILDIGCGDGTYTIELVKRLSVASATAFDAAEVAVARAKERYGQEYPNFEFRVGSIYASHELVAPATFDVVVLRGLLHHLYEPERAIASLARVADAVLFVEPNGFNPITKMIEKFSSYHRKHEEKSYRPPVLNRWFENEGYGLIDRRFFGVVPYFCPTLMAKALKIVEPYAERIPVARHLCCGTHLALYRKVRRSLS